MFWSLLSKEEERVAPQVLRNYGDRSLWEVGLESPKNDKEQSF